MDGVVPQVLLSPLLPVGVSLLAMAVGQATSLLNINPPSRAGSLPHWMGSSHRPRAARQRLHVQHLIRIFLRHLPLSCTHPHAHNDSTVRSRAVTAP
ncbi:MAG: hypothetical protein C0411_23670 [Pseudomonas sp.]|nr:hypothetical protein [Pseudomonas sp.]